MFASYAFQTVGITMTTVSKSAFITGTSVLMVPLFAALFMKRMPDRSSILGAVMAFFGLGLMTLTGNTGVVTAETVINLGDLLTLMCAVLFALYILAVGKYTVQVDSIPFAIIQIGTVAVMSAVSSLAFETPVIPEGSGVWFNILFLAVVCTSMAFIVQNVAQKYTSSTHTALIYSGEPVFAAIFAYIVVGEVMGVNGVIGAALILMGLLAAELNLLERFFGKEKPGEVPL
jgi:drug/metabolite transporter (DMT)-like permease